jgi:hypothetical protein
MSDNKQCHAVMDSTKRLVGAAIDLGKHELGTLTPARILQFVESKPVQDALEALLKKEADALIAEQKKGGALKLDAPGLLKKAGEATGKALSEEYIRVLKSSPHFKKMEDAAEQVVDDFNCSPTGVFLDENKTVLVIVGAVLAVGGATALYAAKIGNWLASPIEGLSKKVKVGSFILEGKVVKFQPEGRDAGASFEVTVPGRFKGKLVGGTDGGKPSVSTDATITFPMGKPAAIDFGYHFSLSSIPQSPSARSAVLQGPGDTTIDYRLFLRGKWEQKNGRYGDFSFDAMAFVRNNIPGMSLNATYGVGDPHFRFGAGLGTEWQPNGVSARGTLGLSGLWADYPWRADASGRFGLTPGPADTAGMLAPRPDFGVGLGFTLYLEKEKPKPKP